MKVYNSITDLSKEFDKYLIGNWKCLDYELGKCRTEIESSSKENIFNIYFGDWNTKQRRTLQLEFEDTHIVNCKKLKNILTIKEQRYSDKIDELIGCLLIKK